MNAQNAHTNRTESSRLLDSLQARGLAVAGIWATDPKLSAELRVEIVLDDANEAKAVTTKNSNAIASGALEANVATATFINGQEPMIGFVLFQQSAARHTSPLKHSSEQLLQF